MADENMDVTRRKFLKNTAAVSAAAVVGGCAASVDPTPTTKAKIVAAAALPATLPAGRVAGSDRIKVGLVGCGGRGTGAAKDVCEADKAVQIVALGDLFKDHLDDKRAILSKLGDQYNVPDDKCFVGFDAYKNVIDHGGIDIVMLCTPPGFRPMHYQYAVEKGKNVFMEKPVAVDPAGIRSVLATSELAKSKNLGVLTGTLFRHHTTHRDAIKQIHDGVFGDIVGGRSYYNVGYLWNHPRDPKWSDVEYQIRNWLYYTWLSGDHIVEQDVHRIDIMNWVMQAHPVKVYGMGGRQVRTQPEYGNIYDHFSVEYEYPGGVVINNQCRQIDNTDFRVTEYFVGTKGVIEPSKGPKTSERVKPEPWGVAYVREHKDLIDSLRAGKPINEGKQIAETCLTAIMGRMSAYTGKEVTWEQAMNSKLDLWPKGELAFGPMPVPPVPMPGKTPLV
jgi:predicted dehydrogenase